MKDLRATGRLGVDTDIGGHTPGPCLSPQGASLVGAATLGGVTAMARSAAGLL